MEGRVENPKSEFNWGTLPNVVSPYKLTIDLEGE
jgi:hypothetical protein